MPGVKPVPGRGSRVHLAVSEVGQGDGGPSPPASGGKTPHLEQLASVQGANVTAASFDYEPRKVVVKPKDQVGLSDKELQAEITKVLKVNNPQAPNYKEKAYKLDATVDQTAFHLSDSGFLILKESDEAKEYTQSKKDAEDKETKEAGTTPAEGEEAAEEAGTETADAATGDEEKPADADGEEDEDEDQEGGDNAPLRNQFNYSERASQTFNNPSRDRNIVTEPPPMVLFETNLTQWAIYDAYVEDLKQQAEKEKKGGKRDAQQLKRGSSTAAVAGQHPLSSTSNKDDINLLGLPSSADGKKENADIVHTTAMLKSLKIMERMVNQNTFDDIAQDYKYWEDASDNFREEGVLLPLWRFQNEKCKRKHVTAIVWNTEYQDLFAVGYGSYDFLKQGNGVIACYSLKNPSNPEYYFVSESGVMCLDFHPQHSSLLAVGLYDGTVMVFDVRQKSNRPIFQSTVKNGKHTDPVWQVRWQEEDLAKNLNFFSISSDGRVTLWTLSKNELQHTDVMQLKLISQNTAGALPGAAARNASAEPIVKDEGELTVDEDVSLGGLAGGSCFDFNKASDHLFVVGTEEGRIHKCSKAYNSQYLESYTGHEMAVYSVSWNHFHPRIFLSCSADWTVKLWDHQKKNPLMYFDLNNSVSDATWAPYSSTVFAAVTADGKVHVFDLNENKNESLCEQQIVRKAKLTKICFNPHDWLLLVGDDHGTIHAMKLSPNLRKQPRLTDEKGHAITTKEKAEVEKMDVLLANVEKNQALGSSE